MSVELGLTVVKGSKKTWDPELLEHSSIIRTSRRRNQMTLIFHTKKLKGELRYWSTDHQF